MEQEKLRKLDVLIAVGSGALTGTIDAFLVKDIDLRSAHEWGKKEVEEFVMKFAKHQGIKGGDLAEVVDKLEKKFPMDGDLLTNKFGGGGYHHLRDFSHHPTLLGCFFSILMQFTGKGYGTDTQGNFVSYDIEGWSSKPPIDCIYLGTVQWLFHLISDIAGSSSTLIIGKEGTGLPGPVLSGLKMLSSCPGIKKIMGEITDQNAPNVNRYVFSETCSKLFRGTLLGEHDEKGKIVKGGELPFDFRTELGIVNESLKNKQYIPVLLNELVVSSFYSVSRFIDEIDKNSVESITDLERIDVKRCLPWKNETLKHMRMISSVTFSTIDISAAGINAAVKNKNNKTGFALDFIQGVNYWGIGDLALSSNSEIALVVRKSTQKFYEIAEKKKEELISSVPDGEEWYYTAKMGVSTAGSILKIGTPVGFVFAAIGVYTDISTGIKELNIAKEERIRIEEACAERIAVIQENQELIDRTVSDYFVCNYEVFEEAFNKMDHAVATNNSDEFIEGNVMIQEKLDYDTRFRNQSEFDSLMDGDDAFKL